MPGMTLLACNETRALHAASRIMFEEIEDIIDISRLAIQDSRRLLENTETMTPVLAPKWKLRQP